MTLYCVGNVIIDQAIRISALPERGGDVVGRATGMLPGGAFNLMAAAVRQGLDTVYVGGHGTGPFGDRVRLALAAEGIRATLEPTLDSDSGYDLALTDGGGERTFITVFGAEAQLSQRALDSIAPGPGDFVYVSGYAMLPTTNAAVVGGWLDLIDPAVTVLVDPGPLVADIPPALLDRLAARADWLSCNSREAAILTGVENPDAASAALLEGWGHVVVRLGADGCLVDGEPIAGFRVDAVDTNGAGDAHAGAFLAAVAAGEHPFAAARRANACAALATTRSGPATAPTREEVDALL